MYINGTHIKNTKQWKDFNLWMDYFDEKEYLSYYVPFQKLFHFTNDSFLFNNQTIYKFERSKSFIDKWIAKNGIANFQNNNTFKVLVFLALIFSKNTHFSLQEIEMTIRPGSTKNKVLKSLFLLLDIYNIIPKTFIENIVLWTELEFKLIKHLLDGKSVRKFQEIQLSKKEAHLFLTANNYNFYKHQGRNLLQNYISFCKIIKSNSMNRVFIERFFSNIHFFTNSEGNESKHYKFWNSIYNTLSKWTFNDTHIELNEILDYISFEVKYNKNFTLKGRNPDSISRTVVRWHREIYGYEEVEYKGIEWKGTGIPNSKFEIKSKTFHFTQIKTGERLHEEGSNLEHCVITYLPQFVKGNSSIWNLHIEGECLKNDLTIEVKDNKVAQVSGYRNRHPNKIELEAIEQWLCKE